MVSQKEGIFTCQLVTTKNSNKTSSTYIKQGESAAQLAREYGIGYSTVHKWKAASASKTKVEQRPNFA
ncbi:hypothetical protein ACL36S_16185 [Lactiplantibacillus plantarum]